LASRERSVSSACTVVRATDDYPEALRRAHAFAEAGADLVFVEDPRSAEDVERLPRDLDGIPLMIDVFETWPWTQRPVRELEQLGYRLAIYCLSATLAYAHAAREVFRTLRDTGHTRACEPRLLSRREYEAVLGLDPAAQSAGSALPA
jgi:2-methylisocitrate lyase-like PEP mutase family enzyme